jgi:arylformamidase
MQYTEEFCEREYNVRALVPSNPQQIARWTEESRRARQTEACFPDIAYGTAPGQTLDFFPVRSGVHGDVPLLVFIHGGYWRLLDKSDFSYVAPPLTHAGAAVAVINYRLVPSVPLEELVRDVLLAVTWCYLHAGHYGANPHRLYVAGHSAGGHLAAMMLAAHWPRWHGALPPEVVRGGLAVSGLYDLEPLCHAPFINSDLKLDQARALALSPALMPAATHAPLITSVGGNESSEFRRHTAFLAERWKTVFLKDVPMPGHDHFSICTEFGNRQSPLVRAALEMMGL